MHTGPTRDTIPDYQEYLQSEHWQRLRREAIRLADGRCQLCNNSNDLQVHHRHYDDLGHEQLRDLTVLCGNCHCKFHDTPRRGRKVIRIDARSQVERRPLRVRAIDGPIDDEARRILNELGDAVEDNDEERISRAQAAYEAYRRYVAHKGHVDGR